MIYCFRFTNQIIQYIVGDLRILSHLIHNQTFLLLNNAHLKKTFKNLTQYVIKKVLMLCSMYWFTEKYLVTISTVTRVNYHTLGIVFKLYWYLLINFEYFPLSCLWSFESLGFFMLFEALCVHKNSFFPHWFQCESWNITL